MSAATLCDRVFPFAWFARFNAVRRLYFAMGGSFLHPLLSCGLFLPPLSCGSFLLRGGLFLLPPSPIKQLVFAVGGSFLPPPTLVIRLVFATSSIIRLVFAASSIMWLVCAPVLAVSGRVRPVAFYNTTLARGLFAYFLSGDIVCSPLFILFPEYVFSVSSGF